MMITTGGILSITLVSAIIIPGEPRSTGERFGTMIHSSTTHGTMAIPIIGPGTLIGTIRILIGIITAMLPITADIIRDTIPPINHT